MALTIQLLRDSQIEAAKAVITEVCFEFFGQAPVNFEDMDAISSQYVAPTGIFMVLMDDKEVVGTGAIRRLDEQTCELKRMWFLAAYRGKGHGAKMAELLFEFARSVGYKRARLDTSPSLGAASKLFRRLGFYVIKPYNDGPSTIYMEKFL
jgi:putative acetyltransferase